MSTDEEMNLALSKMIMDNVAREIRRRAEQDSMEQMLRLQEANTQ